MLCLKSLLNSIHNLHDCSICLSGVKSNVKKMLLVFFKITNDIIGITQQTKTHEEHKIIWCLSHLSRDNSHVVEDLITGLGPGFYTVKT